MVCGSRGKKGFQKHVLQLSYKLEVDSQESKGNQCEQSSCAHKTARHNSSIQLKHLPMNRVENALKSNAHCL